MYRLALPLIFFASAFGAGPISLPPDFQVCSRSTPDLPECIRTATQSAVKYFKNGSKKMGVRPLEPLEITELGISQGTGPVAIDLTFKNLLIHGISNIRITSVKANLEAEEKTIHIDLTTDKTVSLVGSYKIDGKVLVLPIKGEGNSRIDLIGADASIELRGKVVKKDGVEYLIFNAVNFSLEPKTATIHFENLFNGDKTLGDGMNKFLNENWDQVYGELKQSIQETFATVVLSLSDLFTKIPYDVILPK